MIWLWDGICEIVECLCKESIRFTEAGRDREEWSNIQNSEDRDEIEKQDDVVMIKSWNVNMQFYFKKIRNYYMHRYFGFMLKEQAEYYVWMYAGV